MIYYVQYSQLIQILKNLIEIVCYCVYYFLILITADCHIQIGRIHFFLPGGYEIIRCGVTR